MSFPELKINSKITVSLITKQCVLCNRNKKKVETRGELMFHILETHGLHPDIYLEDFYKLLETYEK